MAEVPKIVRQRLAAQTPGGHPDPDVLTAFGEQRLSKAERTPVLAHLAHCADCREIVALAAPSSSAGQPLIALVSRRWWSTPVFQYGAAAAAVAAVALGLVLLQPTHTRNLPAPEVAQNEVPTKLREKPESAVTREKRSQETAMGMLSDQASRREAVNLSAQRAKQSAPAEAMVAQSKAKETGADIDTDAKDQVTAARDQQSASSANQVAVTSADTAQSSKVAALNSSAVAGAGAAGPNLKAEAKTREAAAPPASAPPNVAVQPTNAARAADELALGKAGPAVEKQRTELFRTNTFSNKASPWRIASGRLQHFDGGRAAWEDVSVSTAQRLSVVGNLGSEVWVGGADGRMFYSNDQGAHWITVSTGGWSKDATFTGLTPTALRSVEVYLSNGERWRSADGGASWTRYH